MSKQRFYPVRNADNPNKVTLEPISEELYHALYPEIWRTQKRMHKLGRCVCPKSKLWMCDADCLVCEYCAFGNQSSIDTPINSDENIALGDVIADEAPTPESIALDRALLEMLYQVLDELDPDGKRICQLIAEGKSERESAKILDMPRSTFKHRWDKLKADLYEKLKEYI